MTTHERAEARADMVRYHKALITNRWQEALQIERDYGFDGLPPQLVSVGLQAIADGRCPWDAIEEPMEGQPE